MGLVCGITVPTLLTLVRLILSPLIIPVILVHLVPFPTFYGRIIAAALFILLGLTDFLDGYIARRFAQESGLGALLDPLADKFLMFSALIALVSINRVSYLTAIVIIGREFFIMGLREYALTQSIVLPVMWAGKIKTALQFLYIVVVILHIRGKSYTLYSCLEDGLLIAVLFFTIYSALLYYQSYSAQLAVLGR